MISVFFDARQMIYASDCLLKKGVFEKPLFFGVRGHADEA
jgi:hypothetical protein